MLHEPLLEEARRHTNGRLVPFKSLAQLMSCTATMVLCPHHFSILQFKIVRSIPACFRCHADVRILPIPKKLQRYIQHEYKRCKKKLGNDRLIQDICEGAKRVWTIPWISSTLDTKMQKVPNNSWQYPNKLETLIQKNAKGAKGE